MTWRKNVLTALSCMLVLTVMSACSNDPAATASSQQPEPHTHAPSQQWYRDPEQHWHVCECGEKLDAAEHTLVDDCLCQVCGSEFWDFGEGAVDIYDYDEHGNTVRVSTYEGGDLVMERQYEIEYDADGNMLTQKQFENSALVWEEEYALHPDGWSQVVRSTMYQENGEKYVSEYDLDGNILSTIGYGADGTIQSEAYSEYTTTPDGVTYQSKMTSRNEGIHLICEYNEFEDITSRVKYVNDVLEYEERYEREYNEEGQQVWEKTYRNGMLTHEITGYAELETDDYWMRYPETEIDYDDDGTKLVTYRGENGEVETETFYAVDGAVTRVLRYTYETDEDGNWSHIKVYDNEELRTHREYGVSSDGWSYMLRETEYMEDGTRLVCEFDENEAQISESWYDEAGNRIE